MDIQSSSYQLKYKFFVAALEQLKVLVCSIMELAATILESKDNTLTEAQESDLKIIHHNARSLQGMINHWFELEESESTYLSGQFDFGFLSHSVRTPIASIIGFSRVILQGIDGPVAKEQKVRFNQIEKDGERLLQIVNQVFDVWRIEDHRAEDAESLFFENINIGEFIVQIVDGIKQSTEIEIEVNGSEDLPIIWGNESTLHSCVYGTVSVLSNNFKQGRIIIDGNINEKAVIISIRNEQYVLPDSILEDFNHMAEASLLTCHQFDEVLDLCISRSAIKIHGGKMNLDNQELGSFAEFTLPIRE